MVYIRCCKIVLRRGNRIYLSYGGMIALTVDVKYVKQYIINKNKEDGLRCKVYNNIEITEDEDNSNFVAFVIDKDWNHKIKNLQNRKSYTGDVAYRGVSYAYSSHSRFRENLIRLIDRPDLLDDEGKIHWSFLPSDIPFYDLIDFADNEGCLDWEVSAKIYSDFEKYNDKAKSEMHEYDYNIYETWMETFNSAKENGVVVFS